MNFFHIILPRKSQQLLSPYLLFITFCLLNVVLSMRPTSCLDDLLLRGEIPARDFYMRHCWAIIHFFCWWIVGSNLSASVVKGICFMKFVPGEVLSNVYVICHFHMIWLSICSLGQLSDPLTSLLLSIFWYCNLVAFLSNLLQPTIDWYAFTEWNLWHFWVMAIFFLSL